MPNTQKDIIVKLKEVREEKGYSFGDIMNLVEENGDYVSKTTLSRVFSDGSENLSFRYEDTIRPIANALLDIENIEETDNLDTQAMKSLLKYKNQRISDLEKQIESLETSLLKEKDKAHEKLDKERLEHERRVEFLTNQISLKDKRMDQLLEAVFTKDQQHKELLEHIISCPYKGKCSEETN